MNIVKDSNQCYTKQNKVRRGNWTESDGKLKSNIENGQGMPFCNISLQQQHENFRLDLSIYRCTCNIFTSVTIVHTKNKNKQER